MLLILFCFVQLLVYLLFGVQFPPGSDHIQNLSLLLMIAMMPTVNMKLVLESMSVVGGG